MPKVNEGVRAHKYVAPYGQGRKYVRMKHKQARCDANQRRAINCDLRTFWVCCWTRRHTKEIVVHRHSSIQSIRPSLWASRRRFICSISNFKYLLVYNVVYLVYTLNKVLEVYVVCLSLHLFSMHTKRVQVSRLQANPSSPTACGHHESFAPRTNLLIEHVPFPLSSTSSYLNLSFKLSFSLFEMFSTLTHQEEDETSYVVTL